MGLILHIAGTAAALMLGWSAIDVRGIQPGPAVLGVVLTVVAIAAIWL